MPGHEPLLLTKSAYARRRSVSPSLVTAWRKAGRIAMVGERVDAMASDRMLEQSLDPARGGRGGWSDRSHPAHARALELDADRVLAELTAATPKDRGSRFDGGGQIPPPDATPTLNSLGIDKDAAKEIRAVGAERPARRGTPPPAVRAFQASKARREAALAEQEEFEAARLRGEIFRLRDLERASAEVGVLVQQRFALLPTRLASIVGPKYGIEQRALANDIEDELVIAQEEIVAALRALPRNTVRTVQ